MKCEVHWHKMFKELVEPSATIRNFRIVQQKAREEFRGVKLVLGVNGD